MAFNNLEYQRKYIAKYKQTQFGKISTKISQIKFKARFYYNYKDVDMTLTTDTFFDILNKFEYKCSCCGATENINPCLPHRMCNGGEVVPKNCLPMCSDCIRSYQARAKSKLSFHQWYKSYKCYSDDRYDQILAHIKKE